jgi:hypothetical protein
LILWQNQALLVIFLNIMAGPKQPKKTPVIPENRTGSGRLKGNAENDKFEIDVWLPQ